ncbi:FHA domain-containing protein [Aquabacterium fontiphilum]|jgi:pSer/pThr/pTyr-binding forkhead associated (FHA) protein|uniref:FHA domain-containing protein n=1 Tax=Aquabacterium fontiphilum TaxID=450365 RepID=UPI00137776AA|nr:FHA domain-containing protein [Aquabacterium fontiphilum]NBD20450.1 FHA domain-containing protein [Aquabacterium fontiphilum]
MGKLVVSLDGVVIKEVQVTKDRTSLGRRPYNDIVIDNLAVSGEHAVLQMVGNDLFIEDLNSTNGTYINGKAVKKQLLQHNDTIEIGKYKVKYLVDDAPDYEKTMIMRPGASGMGMPGAAGMSTSPKPAATPPASGFGATLGGNLNTNFGGLGSQSAASIKVLNGAAAGREVMLTKVVTTVGKPGVQVASITKRPGGYVFAHVEGASRPMVNGQAVAGEPVQLKSGDVIELAGTQMQFVQA